jgi:hypothetical protein
MNERPLPTSIIGGRRGLTIAKLFEGSQAAKSNSGEFEFALIDSNHEITVSTFDRLSAFFVGAAFAPHRE